MTDDPIDRVVAEAIRARETRERGYRAQSLKLHPWVCGRCGREFDQSNLHELTVHHKDHNHDNNPLDGSNWKIYAFTATTTNTGASLAIQIREPSITAPQATPVIDPWLILHNA